MNIYGRVACVVIVSALAGCFRPSFEPSGASVEPGLARQACERINSSRKPVDSLRVLADATISSKEERASFRYVVLSKEPSSFRVDVLPVNGALTLGLLVAHGGKAVWLDAQEKTYAESDDERALVAEYLGLNGVSREIAVALLTGVVPALSCSEVRLYQLPGGDRLFVDDKTKTAWRVRGSTHDLVSAQILDDSGDGVMVEGTFTDQDGGPSKGVTLEIFSPGRARVDLSLARVVYNPPLGDQLFEVRPPKDYSRVD